MALNEDEKQVIREMYKFIELLHHKVKVLDDIKERAMGAYPLMFTQEQLAKWEEANNKIAAVDLQALKSKVEAL